MISRWIMAIGLSHSKAATPVMAERGRASAMIQKRALRSTRELAPDAEAPLEPAREVAQQVDRADPAAEGASAHCEVEDQHDRCAEQHRSSQAVAGGEDLQHRVGVREGYGAQDPRTRQVAREDTEMRVGSQPEEDEDPQLYGPASEPEAVCV